MSLSSKFFCLTLLFLASSREVLSSENTQTPPSSASEKDEGAKDTKHDRHCCKVQHVLKPTSALIQRLLQEMRTTPSDRVDTLINTIENQKVRTRFSDSEEDAGEESSDHERKNSKSFIESYGYTSIGESLLRLSPSSPSQSPHLKEGKDDEIEINEEGKSPTTSTFLPPKNPDDEDKE